MGKIMIQKKEPGLAGAFFKPETFGNKKLKLKVLETRIASELFDYSKDEEIEQFEKDFPVGTELYLYRDINNPNDQWAVEITTEDKMVIGYISRFKNESVARLMDAGKRIGAVIISQEEMENTDWNAPTEKGIPIAVYMED